jgi:anti-sigma factor RsiW
MSCEKVQKLFSPLLDLRITGPERESVLAHLASCSDCAERLQVMVNLRADLRRLPQPSMPAYLAQKLRVLASHERARSMRQATWSRWLAYRAGRLELSFNNLMRPLALPFAGGLLSALVVFSFVFVPSFGTARPLGFDPAIELVTPVEGTVVGAPNETPGEVLHGPALACDKTIVELTVDASGNVRDWTMVRGQMTEDVMNMIIWSKFIPATYFGRPVTGKVQVALHSAVEHGART